MSTMTIAGDLIEATEVDMFDLDVDIAISEIMSSPTITSWSICTPGCTSAGGGSNCSFCC